MKLKHIKLAQTIRVEKHPVDSFLSADVYDLELQDGGLIRIMSKAHKTITYTTIFNTIYFEPLEDIDKKAKSVTEAVPLPPVQLSQDGIDKRLQNLDSDYEEPERKQHTVSDTIKEALHVGKKAKG